MNAVGNASRIAGVNDWAKFLAPLVPSVRNKPDSSEFTPFCAACADALAIPADWLTVAKRRDAMATWKYWPSVSDVADLFADEKRHAMDMRALSAPALPPPAPTPRAPLTIAEILGVQAKVAALRTDLDAASTRDKPAVKACHMTRQQILAQCEILAAKGNRIAAYRAEQLRKALG